MSRKRGTLDPRTYQDRKHQDELTGYKRKQGIRLLETSWDTIDQSIYSLPQIIEFGIKVIQEMEKKQNTH